MNQKHLAIEMEREGNWRNIMVCRDSDFLNVGADEAVISGLIKSYTITKDTVGFRMPPLARFIKRKKKLIFKIKGKDCKIGFDCGKARKVYIQETGEILWRKK